MSSGRDERLLRLAQGLADGRPIDWARLARENADLLTQVECLRQLEAIAVEHQQTADRETARGSAARRSSNSPEPPLFTWGVIEVLGKLGRGGFAEVYRGWDRVLEREVALKLARTGRGARIDRWLDEARRLARVRHPNVLVVHGADVWQGRAGFWTDLIHGRTLETVLRRQGPLGGAEATLIGLDLCRALASVHAAGLVHGDLKASNVMREGLRDRTSTNTAGRIVLMDFGASSEASPSHAGLAAFVTPLTCAPEVMRGERPSPSSDVYSLGVLLYRLVGGRYPIEPRDLADLKARIEVGQHTPLRDLRSDLGTAFVRAVEGALEPDPARRFTSVGQVEQALYAALQ